MNVIKIIAKGDLIKNFPVEFADCIGTIKWHPLLINLKNDPKQVFLKAQPVAFASTKATDLELERLTTTKKKSITKPVDSS